MTLASIVTLRPFFPDHREMHDGLGIGVRLKGHALGAQFILEFEEIFDDAVLHHDHALGLAEMRMGVARLGRAVRGPARLADAGRAVDGRLLDQVY